MKNITVANKMTNLANLQMNTWKYEKSINELCYGSMTCKNKYKYSDFAYIYPTVYSESGKQYLYKFE